MPACCILYTTDQAYLFPTIVSAIQARGHASANKADVLVFGFGIGPGAERDFAPICHQAGIRFVPVGTEVLNGATVMMSRLFLNNFVPTEYSQYLYIDGDVQIIRSLDALVDAEVPPGRFLAANDPMTFMLSEDHGDGQGFARHMNAIGLSPTQSDFYFNTGVLRINRSGWENIGLRAWELVQKERGSFRFPDQDPLNLAAADAHMTMSLAWNFPIFMRNSRVEAQIQPHIYHFMSNPKPWQGAFPPWTTHSYAVYRDVLTRHPALSAYYPAFPLKMRVRYHLQQRYKKATETFTWGHSARRDRILHYEEHVMFTSQGWAQRYSANRTLNNARDPAETSARSTSASF